MSEYHKGHTVKDVYVIKPRQVLDLLGIKVPDNANVSANYSGLQITITVTTDESVVSK